VTQDTRGKGLSFCHLGINIGHLFSSLGLFYLTKDYDPRISFSIASAYGLLAAVILMFFVTEPKNHISYSNQGQK